MAKKTGVVIGKFYPPHLGHSYLITTALSQTDKLFVIVCHRKDQTIPGDLRASWLKEMHPSAEVMVVDDILKDDDSQAWATYTKKILAFAPDIVFTSEDYGLKYASLMGSKHVMVDRDRKSFNISGSMIRTSPLQKWDMLHPCVRAHYAIRICVLGAESTGTTTLSKDLASHFNTVWVEEYGRNYFETHDKFNNPTWTHEEFLHIALTQNMNEDESAKSCNKILICDTDSFATCLWEERYLGSMSEEVKRASSGREKPLYLVTDVDIPFVQDGTRDGETIRVAMHHRFIKELKARSIPFEVINGDRKQRLHKAIQLCDAFLKT